MVLLYGTGPETDERRVSVKDKCRGQNLARKILIAGRHAQVMNRLLSMTAQYIGSAKSSTITVSNHAMFGRELTGRIGGAGIHHITP